MLCIGEVISGSNAKKSDFLLCLKQRGKNDAPSKKLKKGGDEIKYKLKY